MLVITSSEFRNRQREYLDKADRGEEIIVQRGHNKSYSITPLKNDEEDDDRWFTPEVRKELDQAIKEAGNGEVITIKTKDELKRFLDGL